MIDLIWDKVLPLLKVIEDKSPEDVSIEVVKDQLRNGDTLLVISSRDSEVIAINILEVCTLDTGIKVLYIPITSGSEMELWLENFLDLAKVIAKDFNCVELRGLSVRNGWMRKLKPFGWEELLVTIRCKLGD